MRGRAKANARFVRGRLDRRAIKKCPKCTKEIPVACKTCPKCKNHVGPFKAKTEKVIEEEPEEEVSQTRRRTERIRRAQPKYFSSMEISNRYKRGTKRKSSNTREVKQTSNSINPDKSSPGYRGNRRPGTLGLRYHSESGKTHIMKPDSLDLDGPKRRRGRPKSVSAADSDKDKTPSEEDWYGHLPPEKFLQYKIILAEINRKISTQSFKPDG